MVSAVDEDKDDENMVSDIRIEDDLNEDDTARSSNHLIGIQYHTTNVESSHFIKLFVVSTNTSTSIQVQIENEVL